MSSIHFLAPVARVIQAFAALTISQGLPLPPDPLQYGVLGTQFLSGSPCLHDLLEFAQILGHFKGYLNMYVNGILEGSMGWVVAAKQKGTKYVCMTLSMHLIG